MEEEEEEEEVGDTAVPIEVTGIRMAAAAGDAEVDLEVVAVADLIVVLTEGVEVDREEEAWGECYKNIQCPCYQSCLIKTKI